jgi:hypothetical protein
MVRGNFERRNVDEKVILKWVLKKQCGRVWTGFIWLRIGALVNM